MAGAMEERPEEREEPQEEAGAPEGLQPEPQSEPEASADEEPSEDGEVPGFQSGDPEQIQGLLAAVHLVSQPKTSPERRRRMLEQLCMALRPQRLRPECRHAFIKRAIGLGLPETAVRLIESGGPQLALAASNLVVDFTFGSDMGARVVLKVFDRIVACFKKKVFEASNWDQSPLLEPAVLLCTNIAALCPSGHQLIIPLVQPICLRIINSPLASEELRGNTITLLANLSMTVATELRALRVADVLLSLVLDGTSAEAGRSVAESVIIYLHGGEQSEEVDKLMSVDVVGNYCVPLMEASLAGGEFRGMYPHLVYSARVFEVLARSRAYAEALVADSRVVPLLLEATREDTTEVVGLDSELEGRRLALLALSSLAGFRLWPEARAAPGHDRSTSEFFEEGLPVLLRDGHNGIRAAASELWARFNGSIVHLVQRLGRIMEDRMGLPDACWRLHVVPFLFSLPAGA